MPLKIETFSNVTGGNALFKALTHPLAAQKASATLAELCRARAVVLYDPLGIAELVNQVVNLEGLPLGGYFVQDVEHLGRVFAGHGAEPITTIGKTSAAALFIVSFDAARLIAQIEHMLPPALAVYSLDAMRLPDEMLSDRGRYLSALNFATNFAFFREAGGHHTRLVSANYWGSYGAKAARLWCRLYDSGGAVLAEWTERLGPPQSAVILDSREIRKRFSLPEFTGQLFVHAAGIKGHDVVKYALDTYGDSTEVLSCTHDANSWPAEFYAGLPAPAPGEEVVLWVQNSLPFPIPAGQVALNVMGRSEAAALDEELAPFATRALSAAELLPDARWPAQIEVKAGKYFVRPRYEVVSASGRRRIAHVNVERSDLKPDPKLPLIADLMGKGHILPAPILPLAAFTCEILPTPMARDTWHFPLRALIYDASGEIIAEHPFGNLPRDHTHVLDVDAVLEKAGKWLPSGYGHVELIYDFTAGEEADGWLHGLFRYRHRTSGHAAESSFGSHMFNSALVFRSEPQSYTGPAPGLTTRLFLRLGMAPYTTICHLIYPASTPWRPVSRTVLRLTSNRGEEIANRKVAIACSGSFHWRAEEMFSAEELKAAGEGGYVTVRDTTCRLFGYHGLTCGEAAFSLDHMFGF